MAAKKRKALKAHPGVPITDIYDEEQWGKLLKHVQESMGDDAFVEWIAKLARGPLRKACASLPDNAPLKELVAMRDTMEEQLGIK